jgi:hypothetical protein
VSNFIKIIYIFFSCPYFRNEVGGEVDRVVALTRETAAKRFQSGQPMGSTGGSGSNDQVNLSPKIFYLRGN